MSTSPMASRPKVSLTIAGLDPGGGAGVIADTRAMYVAGAYPVGVVTALTVQDTNGVAELAPVDAGILGRQLDMLLGDVRVASAKTGILPDAASVNVVAARAQRLGQIVIDPVFVSSSGASFASPSAVDAMISELLPLCELITPNIMEAERISAMKIVSLEAAEEAAALIHSLGAGSVCITGGHWQEESVDIFYDGAGARRLEEDSSRVPGRFHGTGCIFSALAAAYLALGRDAEDAVRLAKKMSWRAMENALRPGSGMAVPWPLPA